MLRLIGAIVVLLLIIGPLLDRTGVLDPGGLLHEFVDLIDAIRSLWDRYA